MSEIQPPAHPGTNREITKATTARTVLGLLAVTVASLLLTPLHFTLFILGWGNMSSHPRVTDAHLDCSQFPDSCIGPRYYVAVICAAVIIALLAASAQLGQWVAHFHRQSFSVILLSLYSAFVVIVGLSCAFILLSP